MPHSPLQLVTRYLGYRFRALNGRGHGMHSPFVYDFIRKVLNDRHDYPAYGQVESLRKKLLADNSEVEVLDLGAGSSKVAGNRRKISSIAKNAAKPPKYGQLLMRMANYYQPQSILELGTSLGISTAYLSLGQPAASIVTLEGAPAIAAKAKSHFHQLGLENIRQVIGNFDDTLKNSLVDLKNVDFAFIDGNHQLEPTVRYFHEILSYSNNNSILVFDDIHWSREMEQAWEEIKQHPATRTSIDLFFVGIVFLRSEFREVQHFEVKY